MDLRVAFARVHSPTDLATLIARLVVGRVTLVLSYLLFPFDKVAQLIGKGLTAVVLGFLVLIILHGVWLPIWGLLVGTSWLWLRYSLSRPVLLLPGMILAIGAHIFFMLIPDPQKVPSYASIAREWPLTWNLWSPPQAYFDQQDREPLKYQP